MAGTESLNNFPRVTQLYVVKARSNPGSLTDPRAFVAAYDAPCLTS